MPKRLFATAIAAAMATAAGSAQTARRAIALDDHSRIATLADPQRSPDGQWVAYQVTTVDADEDKRNTDIWMVRWDGREQIQLTSSPDSETSPRWSPDGRYLAFLASRGTEEEKKKGAQIWLLNRAGGEAQKVSAVTGGVSDIVWSPDSTRLAFVANDVDPDDEPEKKEGWKRKTQPPIVIDRYHFKRDRDGYLKRLYRHIAVFDVATKTAATITTGSVNDASPAWSPDGTEIAFLSKRAHPDPDRTLNQDLWVVHARAGATPRRVTATPQSEAGRPAWSPDGTRIAVLLGDLDQYSAYDQNKLAVVPTGPGPPVETTTILTASLDRAVSNLHWSADGGHISFLLQDNRTQHVARVPAGASRAVVERISSGRRSVRALSPGKDGHYAVLATSPAEPVEIHALENGTLRKLTTHNDALVGELQFAATEEFQSRSKDGTEVHGLVVKPAGFKAGTRYPTLLIIHGGPNSQDEHAFSFDRELFAANGYVVLAINYRGSAGRGNAYQKAIYADWGNLEVVDLLGAVDEAVRQGIADSNRLGIGGWSYGGISTNYAIATDERFKAAVSGAGSSMQFSMYGLDQYIVQYDQEMGQPWNAKDVWAKVSYPFFNAAKIKTPTLFLGGEKDFNVPIAGGEQMYQALKSLGVETELVIYPGQFHGLTIPSYERDRLHRYLDWFNKHLKPTATSTAGR
jgi:dipeptidyl aminopeptidase/acylaminoacyl peptidase